jgi:mannose-1-phosphate guanylyltransferase
MPDTHSPTLADVAVVIMAGGAGTRFWPLSTHTRPKQFLQLVGDSSLLQQSYARARALTAPERILVLTNAGYAEQVREQLPELDAANVIGEPMRRDTAAAVCLGALLCRHRFADPVMVVLTADHRIEPLEEFTRDIRSAAAAARGTGALYTLGIVPTNAATGYGYLQQGELLADDDGVMHHRLRCFREKPDRATAEEYVATGEFLWNSGMFVWTAGAIITELERSLPAHVQLLCAAADADGTPEWPEALRSAFAAVGSTSIDLGVMEKARDVRMVAATFHWNDLGGWLALAEFLEEDDADNHYRGRLATYDSRGNLTFSEDPAELIALVGVDNLVVVRSGARTLVTSAHRAEEIKALVRMLDARGDGSDT